LASIKSRKPDAEEMLPLMDSSVFLAIIVVVVVLMDEFLFIFFETAVTIVIRNRLFSRRRFTCFGRGMWATYVFHEPIISKVIRAVNTNFSSLFSSIAGNLRFI
jgi:hypothetical protein